MKSSVEREECKVHVKSLILIFKFIMNLENCDGFFLFLAYLLYSGDTSMSILFSNLLYNIRPTALKHRIIVAN